MGLFYDLGEMRSVDGSALRYEVEATASRLAIEISHHIAVHPRYRDVEEKTGSVKTLLYFQKVIKDEIYPTARKLCVLRWYLRNERALPPGEEAVSLAPSPVNMLLAGIWPDHDLPVALVRKGMNRRYAFFIYGTLRLAGRRLIRCAIDGLVAAWCRWRYAEAFLEFAAGGGNIAVQHVEGMDIGRRSDIVWLPESGIDPGRVIIYFDWLDYATGRPVSKKVLDAIRDRGMKWVCLKKGALEIKNAPVWYPPGDNAKQPQSLSSRRDDATGLWIAKTGRKLLKDVRYWSAFYRAFNIKLHLITGGGEPGYIARSIACERGNGGFLAGKQRSDFYWPSESYLGQFPLDVFFAWSPRTVKYLLPNVNMMKTAVVSGYPNDLIFGSKRDEADALRRTLIASGARYVIALFDNAHGPEIAHSTADMEKFYLVFLGWLLADASLGIVIKSKKPSVLNGLPQVLPVLAKAKATGRCVCLEEEFGRLPVDAALAADMSVGIGISSALVEAVIAGCRGVHCDLTGMRSHEFYDWGYGRLIFDDLERLTDAMKGHKSDPANSDLGDWAPFLDRLDPFRDGRAGERMGVYLRWCLEGFDEGLNRNTVISRANEKYKVQWGDDMVEML